MARLSYLALLAPLMLTGCAATPGRRVPADQHATAAAEPPSRSAKGNGGSDADKEKNGEENDKEDKKAEEPARTLFAWAIGPPEKKDNGNGAEPRRIETDRPDFSEASSTVGRGRIQLEAGYTFTRDRDGGTLLNNHSFPEALFRLGLFADWFELRIGQNFSSETRGTRLGSRTDSGSEDLYLGVKLGLTEHKKWLPEMALILQTTVPTGAHALSAREVLPGMNLCYSWEVFKGLIEITGNSQFNRAREPVRVGFPFTEEVPPTQAVQMAHPFVEFDQSLSIYYQLTRKWGAYTEGFAFFPMSALGPDMGPEYYFDGGFTYLVNDNFQLDIRAGVGLNRQADNFFTGAGFAIRY
jgi:hypothetical protein